MPRPGLDFIGTGLNFPLHSGPTGGIALVSGRNEIEQAIWLILSTAKGERPMRPDFGCGIHDFVFAPADATTAGHLANEVRSAREQWEPRIEVERVHVRVADDDPAKLYLVVDYVVRANYDPRSLVFPFYVIPEEG